MTGIEIIAAERHRQLEDKGWTTEQDREENAAGELTLAAMCYLCPDKKEGPCRFFRGKDAPVMWPWHHSWWKPSPQDRIRELAKAGALIAAEIDRLQK